MPSRMRELFDHHLKREPAPSWLTHGVPRIDLEKHLEQPARPRRTAPALDS